MKDQFLQPVKDHPCGKFGYVGKIMPCFFSSNTQKQNLVVKNPKTKIRFCVFEKKTNMCFTFSRF